MVKHLGGLLWGKMPFAASLNKVVSDSKGQAIDYKTIDVNEALLKNFSLAKEQIVGCKLSTWLFDTKRTFLRWQNRFGNLDVNSGNTEFKEFLQIQGFWYALTAFVPEPNYLALYFCRVDPLFATKSEVEQAQNNIRDFLHKNGTFGESIFRNNPSSIIIYEVRNEGESSYDYIIKGVNPVALEVEGWERNEVLGKPLGLLRPGVEQFGVLEVFRQVWQTGQTRLYPAHVYREDGEARWFENKVFKLPSGEIVAVYEDVTITKQAELALYAEKEKLRVTLYSIGDAVIATDLKGKIEFLNPVASQLTGWPLNDALGKSLREVCDIFYEDTKEVKLNPLEKALRGYQLPELEKNLILRSRDGKNRSIKHSSGPIKAQDGSVQGAILVFRDVTVEREKEERIKFLSYRDPLTGLYNRAFIEEQLTKLDVEQYYPLSILMGDLDGLKLINDAFGQQVGDQALIKTANLLHGFCPKHAVISRWGGDEFLVLLPNTSEAQVRVLCDRFKDLLATTQVADTQLRLSLGYATKDSTELSLNEVLQEAENNMYTTKLLGASSYRNVVLSSIKKSLFEKSDETEEHGQRMAGFCRKIGEKLGLSALQLDELEVFSMLHDIGKIGISEQILQKPGKLTEAEWAVMKKHPEIGYRIAQTVPELTNIADYILAHHERWDGQGYPNGLKAEEIPLLARILSVVDAYDAMTQDRSYRKALSFFEAQRELKKNAGTQFDPVIVNVFLRCLEATV